MPKHRDCTVESTTCAQTTEDGRALSPYRSVTQGIRGRLQLDNEQQYRDFYAIVERVLAASQVAGKSFASIEMRNHVEVEIFAAVQKQCEALGRFRETVELMRDAPGKESFRKLVFRVNTNLKRRSRERKNPSNRRRQTTQSPPNNDGCIASRSGLNRDDHRKSTGNTSSSEEEDIVHAVEPMWVTGKDGKFRVVALAHEIAACPGRLLDSRYSPSDLRLSEFINRLTKDHDFDPKRDHVELYREDEEAAMVDDQKAWERLILIRYMQGKPLKFLMVSIQGGNIGHRINYLRSRIYHHQNTV